MTIKEEWKKIPKYFGKYEASNLGRVRDYTGKILTTYENRPRGYKFLTLKFNNRPKTITVHRLIASLFLENPNDKPQVNHKNGIKTDNRACNLEWCTAEENMQHASRNGLLKRKKYNRNVSVLAPEDVLFIREMYANNKMSVSEMVDKYGISNVAIYKVINRQSYNYI